MKRILVDVDDTIENLLEAWIKYLNNRYNLQVSIRDCHEWDLQALFPMLTYNQIYDVLGERELWESVEPKQDAMFYLELLQEEEGYEIVLVTSSIYFDIHHKVECVLDKYFSFIPRKNIIVTSRKQLIKGDYLVDDYVKYLKGGDYKKILFTAQHNLDVDITGTDIIRANDWSEVYNIIKEDEK